MSLVLVTARPGQIALIPFLHHNATFLLRPPSKARHYRGEPVSCFNHLPRLLAGLRTPRDAVAWGCPMEYGRAHSARTCRMRKVLQCISQNLSTKRDVWL